MEFVDRFRRAVKKRGLLPTVTYGLRLSFSKLYTPVYAALSGAHIGRGCTIEWGAKIDAGGGSISLGNRCHIHSGAMLLAYGGSIEIGDDCSVNPYSLLYGHGGLTIGDRVLIASGVVIIPANHRIDGDRQIRGQGLTLEGISIANDVWVGSGVRLLDGSVVEDGAVLAAGCVVNGINVAQDTVVGGIPARVISNRSPKDGLISC
jgi:acetyltransferase-like isoleucine patch superfamily enzyme